MAASRERVDSGGEGLSNMRTKRSWTVVAWLVLLAAGLGYSHLRAQAPTPLSSSSGQDPASAASTRALLDRYCVTCHNERLKTAGLSLAAADVARLGDAADVWEKVAVKLHTGNMPPPGAPRPDGAATGAVVSWLETSLDQLAAERPNPGRLAPLHRLNRAEYTNAVRDLLALEIDARSLLPVDDSNHGFDNIAAVLTVSPLLLERYLSAARLISRLAVGDPTISPAAASRTYTARKTLFQDGRMSEDLPFGSRGGLAIRHYFPLDGEYAIKIRLLRNYVDYVRGDVVEAVVRIVNREQRPRVDLQREQIPDGVGVLGAVQPMERGQSSRIGPFCSQLVERGLQPGDDRACGSAVGPGCARRRHVSSVQLDGDLLPNIGRVAEARHICRGEREPCGLQTLVVAGHAVPVQQRARRGRARRILA